MSVNYLLPTLDGFLADYNRCARDLHDFAVQAFRAPLNGSTHDMAVDRAKATLKIFRGLFHSCRRHCCLGFFHAGVKFADDMDAFLAAPRATRTYPQPMQELTAVTLRAAFDEQQRQMPSLLSSCKACNCDGKPKPKPKSLPSFVPDDCRRLSSRRHDHAEHNAACADDEQQEHADDEEKEEEEEDAQEDEEDETETKEAPVHKKAKHADAPSLSAVAAASISSSRSRRR